MASSASSQSHEPRDLMGRFYESFTTGMDDIFGTIPVLDQLSVAGQNLVAAATQQLQSTSSTGTRTGPGIPGQEDPLSSAEAEAELRAFDNTHPTTNPTINTNVGKEQAQVEPFVKPICDIFLEIFELNREDNWLRGRAVVVILHQLLGGTIERKVRDQVRWLGQDDMVLRYIDMLREALWPDGKLRREPRVVRTPAERARTRIDAALVMDTLVPELAASVVGRANARAAARRICAGVNNAILTYVLFLFLFSLSLFLLVLVSLSLPFSTEEHVSSLRENGEVGRIIFVYGKREELTKRISGDISCSRSSTRSLISCFHEAHIF